MESSMAEFLRRSELASYCQHLVQRSTSRSCWPRASLRLAVPARLSIASNLGNAPDLHTRVSINGVAAFVSRRTNPFQVNKGCSNRDASLWLPNVCEGTMRSNDR